jgi:hypothetical protein
LSLFLSLSISHLFLFPFFSQRHPNYFSCNLLRACVHRFDLQLRKQSTSK